MVLDGGAVTTHSHVFSGQGFLLSQSAFAVTAISLPEAESHVDVPTIPVPQEGLGLAPSISACAVEPQTPAPGPGGSRWPVGTCVGLSSRRALFWPGLGTSPSVSSPGSCSPSEQLILEMPLSVNV